jgi:TatD DNase family protein
MILFDSHCHIDDKSYDNDLDDVIKRAKNDNMLGMMIVGVDIQTSLKAIKIANKYENIIPEIRIFF